MPPGLGQNALARVDQDHGQLGVGGAGRHVAGVLLMAGRVGDDEFALVGGKEAVGDVDGDALLPLRLQPVHQQREIDILAGGAELLGILLQRGQRVLEQELGVVKQPPDQRGLAVIHAAAGEKAQQAFLFLARRENLSGKIGSGARSSEIPLLLLLLHRGLFVAVDQPALALGGAGGEHLGDDVFQAVGIALDRAGQRIAAQGAEPHQPLLHLFAGLAASCARHRA